MKFAPIALFVYNRLWHTKKTVESLLQNEQAAETDLIVFSDGPKSEMAKQQVAEVREYVKSIKGFKSIEVFCHDKNKGLAKSIIEGVTQVVQNREAVIVVEDDLVTSPFFLHYMNQGLALYERDEQVISIHGYVYPVKGTLPESFFLKGADCWGWATWKRGWSLFEPDGTKLRDELDKRGLVREFDFDGTYPYSRMLSDQIAGRNDSWAVRWYASAFLKEKLTLYPGVSLVNNIGHDNSGTHSKSSTHFEVALRSTRVILKKIPIQEDPMARAMVSRYFAKLYGFTFNKLVKAVRRLIQK